MIKGLTQPYVPGDRKAWLKLKKDYLSEAEAGSAGGDGGLVDLVVLGASFGKGASAGNLSYFLLGAYDEGAKHWVTVVKLGNGFTNARIDELQILLKDGDPANDDPPLMRRLGDNEALPSWLPNVKGTHKPAFVVNDPADSLVWEVIGTEFTTAGQSGATGGVSIRFPRLVRERTDKSVDDATTVAVLKEILKASTAGAGSKAKKISDQLPSLVSSAAAGPSSAASPLPAAAAAAGPSSASTTTGDADADTEVEDDDDDDDDDPDQQDSPISRARAPPPPRRPPLRTAGRRAAKGKARRRRRAGAGAEAALRVWNAVLPSHPAPRDFRHDEDPPPKQPKPAPRAGGGKRRAAASDDEEARTSDDDFVVADDANDDDAAAGDPEGLRPGGRVMPGRLRRHEEARYDEATTDDEATTTGRTTRRWRRPTTTTRPMRTMAAGRRRRRRRRRRRPAARARPLQHYVPAAGDGGAAARAAPRPRLRSATARAARPPPLPRRPTAAAAPAAAAAPPRQRRRPRRRRRRPRPRPPREVLLGGSYKAYDASVAAKIEAAWAEDDPEVEVRLRGAPYVITLRGEFRQEVKGDPSRWRSVRRVKK